ncbi:MAG: hypothetical protein RR205_01675 [Oscillospiraceae bacterium]
MKILFKFVKWLKKELKKIHIVDKCLIVFMLILLIQSSYSLFCNQSATVETDGVDMIVRTSAASIFGYFLSANFIKKQSKASEQNNKINAEKEISTDINQNNTKDIAVNITKEKPSYGGSPSCVQIFIATSIGIFSLCVLLFFRDFDGGNQSALATVSQFRDFVSTCVGFLIGSGSDLKDNNIHCD